jgi:hypothetical protein
MVAFSHSREKTSANTTQSLRRGVLKNLHFSSHCRLEAYTAIVSGADGGTGVGLVEVFEVK